MSRIYCISGLGADHRLFARLSIAGYELAPLPWVDYDKHDDVGCYAQKMAAQIKEDNPIIIGLSFGGMIAVEIAKQRAVKKLFLVSSAKTSAELGHAGKFLQFVINHKLVPGFVFNTPNHHIVDRFGPQDEEEKELMRSIIRDSDPAFMKWALKALFHWKNSTIPSHITHIHGTADQIIPAAGVHPDYWIEGGQHIMIYSRAAEVGKLITEICRNLSAKFAPMIALSHMQTPFGKMFIGATDAGICLFDFERRRGIDAIFKRIETLTGDKFSEGAHPHFAVVEMQVNEYFAGARQQFDLPLHLIGTPFQVSVWQALRQIPYGETRTYKQHSILMGNEKALRAIAGANGENGIEIIIPCHRVIGTNGSLTGYGGGLPNKKWLLEHESKHSGRAGQGELF